MYISVLVYHFIFCEQKDQILCKHVLGLHTTTHVNTANTQAPCGNFRVDSRLTCCYVYAETTSLHIPFKKILHAEWVFCLFSMEKS